MIPPSHSVFSSHFSIPIVIPVFFNPSLFHRLLPPPLKLCSYSSQFSIPIVASIVFCVVHY
uniref:Putative ovule protein n=1 Tax=Solanum chacoense TaxID=4108 RepID=A0A0V0GG79_SOLCH